MMKSIVILATMASVMALPSYDEPTICNAAAIARGDCTAPGEPASTTTPVPVVAGAGHIQHAMVLILGAPLLA